MKSELGTLIELQKTDTRIRQLNENIETANERRANLEEEFEQHAFSIREIQTNRDAARAKRAELEAHIAEAKSSLERANRNLTTAQDQKQYEAAMREIDSINKQISKHETEILENMEIYEAAEKTLEERAEEVNNLEGNWKKTQAEFDTELENNKTELESLKKERERVFAEVSPRLASIYDRLVTRSRDGIAVAEVIDESCSACFMKLRKQILVDLKTTSEIHTCENCTRIMYVVNEDQTEAVAS
ncbi:MAG: C4-type zinc ribbon domain-containing protein [Pyrinomonadaceae bacterium]